MRPGPAVSPSPRRGARPFASSRDSSDHGSADRRRDLLPERLCQCPRALSGRLRRAGRGTGRLRQSAPRPNGRGTGDRRRLVRAGGRPRRAGDDQLDTRGRGLSGLRGHARLDRLGRPGASAPGAGRAGGACHQPPWLCLAAAGHGGRRRPQPQLRRLRRTAAGKPGLRHPGQAPGPGVPGTTPPWRRPTRRSMPTAASTARSD